MVNGQPVGIYSYDAQSRRVKKIAYGVITYFVYDQFSNLIAESDASGNITREYIYLNDKPLALIDLPLPSSAPPQTISQQVSVGCGTIFALNTKAGIAGFALLLSPFFFLIFFRYTKSTRKSLVILLGCLGAAGVLSLLAAKFQEAKAQTEGEKIYYYHLDHLGTPLAMTDADTNIVWTWQYGPFGEESLWMSPNVINQNLRFPGQYYDSETGLHYNFHRYYSPKLGRYLTTDPARGFKKDPQSFNLYPYVKNPINLIDPEGQQTWPGQGNPTQRTQRFCASRGGGSRHHYGVDIPNCNGCPVRASDSGEIGNETGMGTGFDSTNQVVIYNDDGTTSGYVHVTPSVSSRDHVNEGDIIGFTDKSGGVEQGKEHVHYTYRPCKKGDPGCVPIDPEDHLPSDNNYNQPKKKRDCK